MHRGPPGLAKSFTAAKARWGGKPGELIVNARFLDCGPVRIKVGKMKFAQTGENNAGGALAAGMIALPAMFIISGGNVHVPAGSRAEAKVTEDIQFVRTATGCEAAQTGISTSQSE